MALSRSTKSERREKGTCVRWVAARPPLIARSRTVRQFRGVSRARGLVTRLGVPIFAEVDEDGASHHLRLPGRLFQMTELNINAGLAVLIHGPWAAELELAAE